MPPITARPAPTLGPPATAPPTTMSETIEAGSPMKCSSHGT